MKGSAKAVDRSQSARAWVPVVAATPVVHLVCLLWVPQPLLVSRVIQLFTQLLPVVLCLSMRRSTERPNGLRCWMALAASFAIQVAAQALLILSMFLPALAPTVVRIDDALWLIFGLPILLAPNTFL